MDGEAQTGTAAALSDQLAGIGIAAAVLDAEGRVLRANRALAELLAAGAPEITGHPLGGLLTASAADAEKVQKRQVFLFRRRGRDFWYRLDLFAHADETLAMLVDVTKEQLAMQFARFGAAEHQQLLHDGQIGVWRYDPDRQVYHFSSELSLGYGSSGVGIPLEQLIRIQHRDDVQRDADIRVRITTEGGVGDAEMRYLSADGTWVHLRAHYRAGRRLPSGVYEIFGISKDITPQAIARNAANLSANRLKLALKAANAAVYGYDYKTRKYWASEELRAKVGETLWHGIPDDPLALFVPEDLDGLRALGERVQSSGSGWADARMCQLDGLRWVRLFSEVEDNPSGRPRRNIGLILDIHEQKQQEVALEEACRAAEAAAAAKSNFLASMSHEIRTPLNGVLGLAQSLQGDDLTDAQREKVSIILDSGETLMALLNDVLDLSKIEAGKLEISPIDDDLRESIRRGAMLFRPAAEAKRIALDIEIDDAVPSRLKFDPVRVRQCVSNLLSNALKFTEIGGRVVLRVATTDLPDGGSRVAITVLDSGIGMSRETMDRLFSQFVQADGSISRRFGGTGLGLAISRELARGMAGDIEVTSEPGRGSSFQFSFRADAAAIPRAAADGDANVPDLAMVPKARTESALAGARVLVVDDNKVNRQVIKLFLAPWRAEISEAVNGVDALENLARAPFDIVLLDVHMPVMDGCEAVKAIRASGEAWRGVPVIALTADAMSGDRERYLAAGMTDYVAKPVDQRELIGKIGAILAARRGASRVGLTGLSAPTTAKAIEADAVRPERAEASG